MMTSAQGEGVVLATRGDHHLQLIIECSDMSAVDTSPEWNKVYLCPKTLNRG